MEYYIYDHPILSLNNTTDTEISKGRKMLKSLETAEFKKKAKRKERRLVRQALKGNKVRCNKRPGNSWDLF